MNIENINRATKLQALNMAKFAGIELSESQVIRYTEFRQGIFTRKLPEDILFPTSLSDQELLEKLLRPEQQVVFRSCYPNIFRT